MGFANQQLASQNYWNQQQANLANQQMGMQRQQANGQMWGSIGSGIGSLAGAGIMARAMK